jgi:hypothetical protein
MAMSAADKEIKVMLFSMAFIKGNMERSLFFKKSNFGRKKASVTNPMIAMDKTITRGV